MEDTQDEVGDQPIDPEVPADGGDAKPEGEDGATDDGGTDQQPEDTTDYKEKFAASSRENQRILDENKKIAEELAKERDGRAQLERLNEEYKRVAGESNPDGAKILELEKSIASVAQSLALNKENEDLRKFVDAHPEAAKVSDSLRKLYRLTPTKSLDEIWGENFAPLVQVAKDGSVARITAQKKSAPERTGGGALVDPAAGELPDDFAKWPVAQRKEYLKKKGF